MAKKNIRKGKNEFGGGRGKMRIIIIIILIIINNNNNKKFGKISFNYKL